VQQSSALDTDVAIETPEHIVFRYRLAGPARRLAAYFIDLLVCYTAFAVVAFLILAASMGFEAASGAAGDAFGAGVGLVLLVLFAVQWLYFAVLEAWRGTTPGKAAVGCRVVTTTGRPIGMREAALRNVLRAADALPLASSVGLLSIAGLTSMSVTKRFQRLGDLVAGTMVIVPERARAAEPLVLWPAAEPHESAQIDGADVWLDAEERQAIEMFLRRRSRLGRAREIELASMISPAIAGRFGLTGPDPARLLALVYDRAANAGRGDSPPSERPPEMPRSWR